MFRKLNPRGLLSSLLLVGLLFSSLGYPNRSGAQETTKEKPNVVSKEHIRAEEPKIEIRGEIRAEKYVPPTIQQPPRPRSEQPLGSCNYSIRTAVGYSQADKNLVEQEIRRVYGASAQIAIAVFKAESGLRSNACSSTNDWGIGQVNRTAHPQYSVEYLMNYQNNIQATWAISRGGTNWNPWSVFKNGAYKQYL